MRTTAIIVLVILALLLAAFFIPAQVRAALLPVSEAEKSSLTDILTANPDWQVAYHAETGKLRFLSAGSGEAIPQPSFLQDEATPEDAALNFLASYGELFGLDKPLEELSVMKTSVSEEGVGVGRAFVRFQQVYMGVPVVGAELIVQTDSLHDIRSVSGEILPDLSVSTSPSLSAESARQIALSKVAKDYGMSAAELVATPPELWIYNPAILGGPGPRISRLVWRMDVSTTALAPIREFVLVDAELGAVVLHFNQVDTARNRLTYDAENGTTLPGTLRCNESNPTCSGGDLHEIGAHTYAGDTYDFYLAEHGRDSIDNAGMSLVSSVHYGSNYDNAFWDGAQMVYGDYRTFPLADDVVAHEMTHGVTERESGLFYYYQSGAMNESFSDIWGEFVDLEQATGNDAGDVRWQMGEDVSPGGAIRNMQNPPLFGDPDRMGSPNYYCDWSNLGGPGDNGGVHTNSGVGNKAAYLLTDGDTFNGKTVTGLGYAKVADLFYEVQTNLLTSAADYADLYNALIQACSNLGYSAGDCQEVQDAVDATQMNQQPSGCPAPQAPVCDVGSPVNIFFDDIESGSGNWTAGSNSGAIYWFVPQTTSTLGLDQPYATSGVGNIWGFDQGSPFGGTSDTFLAMNSSVALPANAFMHFNHAYGFETSHPSGSTRYDGGILEYSTNGGASWVNAGPLITHYGYNGTLNSGNPLGAISAFTSDSRGYISSRLDLSTLTGQNVRFRFRIGTDSSVYDFGWFIDDVRIYTCSTAETLEIYLPLTVRDAPPPSPPAPPTDLNATPFSDSQINLTWNDNSNNETGFTIERSLDGVDWTDTFTTAVNVNTYNDTGLPASTEFHYRVKAYNLAGDSGYSNVDNATTLALPGPGICNGDFEQGTTCWTEYSYNGFNIILNSGFPLGVSPHRGSWAAWLGGVLDEVSYVEQQVALAAGSPSLVYWHWIASEDICGFDYGSVRIDDSIVEEYDLCLDANTGGWVQHSVNLSAYAGQTVTVQIRVETDDSLNSNLFVDDVSIQTGSLPLLTSWAWFKPSQATPKPEALRLDR